MTSRHSIQNSKQWQELMIRNQRLAMEVTRLQEQNRLLRRRVHALAVGHLHLDRKTEDKECQTDGTKETGSHSFQKSSDREAEISSLVGPGLKSVSPDFALVGKVKLVEASVHHRRRSHVRNNAMNKLDFDLLEDSSEFLKVEISIPDESSSQLTTPGRRSSRRRSMLRTPVEVEEPGESEPVQQSPLQKRVSEKLAQKVLSPYDVGSERLGAFSPARVQLENEPESSFEPHTPTTPTAKVVSPIARTPRSVKKPLSYQEPSLRAKVRKGFKFFKFA